MEWVLGTFRFCGHSFHVYHFDVPSESGGAAAAANIASLRDQLAVDAVQLDQAAEEIGAVLWTESTAGCLRWLEEQVVFSTSSARRGKKPLSGRRVLELGAGCGVVGAALACAGADVTVTDIASVVPLLQVNAHLQREEGRSIAVRTLNWSEAIPPDLTSDFDFVIGCDLIYDLTDLDGLLKVLQFFVVGDCEFHLAVNMRDGGAGLGRFVAMIEPDFIVSCSPAPAETKGESAGDDLSHCNCVEILTARRRSAPKSVSGMQRSLRT